MARYLGPRRRIVRRLGTDLDGLTTKTGESRPHPPGQHGPTSFRRRHRLSEYAVRLAEKQKVRFHYGLTETQLRNYVRRAARTKGATGENLLVSLEARLDNVVFRLGFASTIPAARQLVRHGHVMVGGHRVSVPSYQVSSGETIEPVARSRQHPVIAAGAESGPSLQLPSYLQRSPDGLGGRCIGNPSRQDVPLDIR